ncbi:hypothetical protein NQD34_016539 [Periophthalmus magnuspinnatus]|nr:hypothetical protein NQD34_016539 [Periophthalmus magnuspinnatus]
MCFSFQKLRPIDELFLFLTYLSTGCNHSELGHRFHIHSSTVSGVIVTWANFLYCLLGSICVWMCPAVIRETLLKDFHGGEDRVILECTELLCQSPSSLLPQSEVFSTHKCHCTFKAMVVICPDGALPFVSSPCEGSMRDREHSCQSGVSLLSPDMDKMDEKGSQVDDLVSGGVHRPVVVPKGAEMPKEEVLRTRAIGRLRVHVERAIQRVKENKVFDTIIPLSISGSINQIFTVACLLSDYQHAPLYK